MEVNWSEFKKFIDDRKLSVQYVELNGNYHLKAFDGYFNLDCVLPIGVDNADTTVFENDYKDVGNIVLEVKTSDGRSVVRSDSRPRGFTTNFISKGDTPTTIGDGKTTQWDFSNSDDIVTDSLTKPIPNGFKRKRIEIGFSEKIYIKEGTLYFFNSPKGQYMDMYVVCKQGAYYEDPNGSIPSAALGLPAGTMFTQAAQNTPVTHYVKSHFMQGSCPMGDELNTEGASESSLPTASQGYVIWIEITTPDSDTESNGSVEMEIYRKRTILLPGESI
jgi:hypothetical protein